MVKIVKKSNLPALRYEVFDKVFDKHRQEMQKELERLQSHEQLYTLVAKTLSPLKLEMDHVIELSQLGVNITFRPGPNFTYAELQAIADTLGRAQVTAELRTNPKGSHSLKTESERIYWSWHNYFPGINGNRDLDRPAYVSMGAHLPKQGLRDLHVVARDRLVSYTTTEFVKVQLPTARPHDWWLNEPKGLPQVDA